MVNHPNRNWRRHMQDAAERWLDRYRWHDDHGARLITDEELHALLQRAYVAGYEARHQRYQKP